MGIQSRTEWPEDKKFGICLSHDVDRAEKKWWHGVKCWVVKRDFYYLKTIFMKYKDNPYWNFESIINIEKKYDIKSTFFFLNESSKIPKYFKDFKYLPMFIGRYKIEDLREVIKWIDREGWEIGVHGSFYSYENQILLSNEKKVLEDIVGHKIIGIRQHNLNLKVPDTWKLQKSVGFMYDASFGSNYEVGFYQNKLKPFFPFNDYFLVIPLTIMDSALFYQYPNMKDAWDAVLKIIKFAEKNGALITVLWHQRVFNENEFPGWSKMYEKIIQEGIRRRAWFGRCVDVWEACKNGCGDN